MKVNPSKLVAVKFTYALEAFGGYWLAYANKSTDYVSAEKPLPTEATPVKDRTHANAGMWQILPAFRSDVSFMDAWKQWGSV